MEFLIRPLRLYQEAAECLFSFNTSHSKLKTGGDRLCCVGIPELWNKLPTKLLCRQSLNSFKKTVKNLLVQTSLPLLSTAQAVNIVTLHTLALFIVTWWYIQQHHTMHNASCLYVRRHHISNCLLLVYPYYGATVMQLNIFCFIFNN